MHVATYTEASMMSADEDSTSSPDEDPYDDTDILNSAGTDEVTAHLAAAGLSLISPAGKSHLASCSFIISLIILSQGAATTV